jgi:hypothetical protein
MKGKEAGLDDFIIKELKLKEDKYSYMKYESPTNFNFNFYPSEPIDMFSYDAMKALVKMYYSAKGLFCVENESKEQRIREQKNQANTELHFKNHTTPIIVGLQYHDFYDSHMWAINVREEKPKEN